MKRKCNLHKYNEMIMEGMANYAAQRIAPARMAVAKNEKLRIFFARHLYAWGMP